MGVGFGNRSKFDLVPPTPILLAYLCLRCNVYLSEEIDGIWARAQPRALRKKGERLEQYLLHLVYKYENSPFGGLCLFPKDRCVSRSMVLESDKLFRRTMGNDFFNLTFCGTPKNVQPSYG